MKTMPVDKYFTDAFLNLNAANKETVIKSGIHRSYPYDFDAVWDAILDILQQYAVIANISRDTGVITYVDIDGILLQKKPFSWEFPFTILVEKTEQGTRVYIYPMEELFASTPDIVSRKYWQEVKKGFKQKQEDFLEKLSVQLEAGKRWPWLTNTN